MNERLAELNDGKAQRWQDLTRLTQLKLLTQLLLSLCLANLSFIGFMGQGHLPLGKARLGVYWLFGPVEREARVRLTPSTKRE